MGRLDDIQTTLKSSLRVKQIRAFIKYYSWLYIWKHTDSLHLPLATSGPHMSNETYSIHFTEKQQRSDVQPTERLITLPSAHLWGQIEGPPETPSASQHSIVLKSLKGVLNASLSDSKWKFFSSVASIHYGQRLMIRNAAHSCAAWLKWKTD